jgi:hypothetical protein
VCIRTATGGKEHPSKSIRQESWYEMAMQNAQKQEASRSMFRGNESSKTSQSEMARITFCLEGAANQVFVEGKAHTP